MYTFDGSIGERAGGRSKPSLTMREVEERIEGEMQEMKEEEKETEKMAIPKNNKCGGYIFKLPRVLVESWNHIFSKKNS